MSATLNPVIDSLKDNVKAVVLCEYEPLAVTLEKVTAVIAVVTVTAQVAVLLPTAVVTVIVALPAATALTVPPDIVATEALLVFHVTFLFVALAGATVAVNVSLLPAVMLVDDLFKVTPVTATFPPLPALTVTAQVAVLLPSAVVTVIVSLPAATALTVPPDTVATVLLLLLHVTFLFEALESATVAVNVSELPAVIVVEVLFKVTPVTATVPPPPPVTVTEQVAVLLPSALVTVITALPADMPVTKPTEDTVATVVLPLLHVTFLFVALEGAMVAVNVSVLPTVMLADDLFNVTPVTATVLLPLVTITAQVAVLLPS
jgi:hypothetical protein